MHFIAVSPKIYLQNIVGSFAEYLKQTQFCFQALTDTGELGGAQVGQHMTHYIKPNGKFAKACEALLASGFRLSWADKLGGQKIKSIPTRVKYTCSDCGLNAWAKRDAKLLCGECEQILLPEAFE